VHFYELPLVFALVGLALYTVLAGADFGAGVWQVAAGRGPRGERLRDHAHHAMAPVWEANHVWLIFVLTVVWTAYPEAFGSIASTLSVPLFIAAIGIILRGAAYALRAGTTAPRELRLIDTVSGVSSILTPFALGAAIGGIASQRVPVGNAAGHLFSSWLNPTSILVATLAVATSAYLAAVYLAADADRLGDSELEGRFRFRALGAGVLTGALALGGLAVLHSDAHPLYHRLVAGAGVAGLVISLLAGVGTLALVWFRRFELARFTAALAVAAIIAGWALAQRPTFLRGLTIQQAAASHDVLVAVVVSVIAGAVILFPSLALLFRLLLRGQFDVADTSGSPVVSRSAIVSSLVPGLAARVAVACLVAGIGFLTVADAGWAHAIGIAGLSAFIVLGTVPAAPAEVARFAPGEAADPNREPPK
jgi:cytochrome bd ubiquinol oxidase subunit II